MATKKASKAAAPVAVTFDEFADMIDTLDLDVEELETFQALGIELASLAEGRYPNVLFAALVWVKMRRDGQPELSWEEARRHIRISLS
jgi:hypothetical protein